MAERRLSDEEMAFGLIEGQTYVCRQSNTHKQVFKAEFICYESHDDWIHANFKGYFVPTHIPSNGGQFNRNYYYTTEEN
jgi:hypothetical protein